MGLTHADAAAVRDALEDRSAAGELVLLLNTADDPVIERILTPRIALTVAEHLAFELRPARAGRHGRHDQLLPRRCARSPRPAARSPARRAYPGYLYSDLASLYERCGRIRGRPGSVTVAARADDAGRRHHPPGARPDRLHHRGPDRALRRGAGRGVYPPVDPLSSLSRLMRSGAGAGPHPRRPPRRRRAAARRARPGPPGAASSPSSSARARSAPPTAATCASPTVFERRAARPAPRRAPRASTRRSTGPGRCCRRCPAASSPCCPPAAGRPLPAGRRPGRRRDGIRGVPPGRAGRTWLSRRLPPPARRLRAARPQAAHPAPRAGAVPRRRRGRDAALGAASSPAPRSGPCGRRCWPAATRCIRRTATPTRAWTSAGRRSWGRGSRAGRGSSCPGPGAEARCPRPRPSSAPRPPTARALSAAVDAAVAEGAARALDEEVAATRFRLRAVQDRWVPRLERAAAALDAALAEAEGADAVRLRLAAAARAPRRAPTAPSRHGTGASG